MLAAARALLASLAQQRPHAGELAVDVALPEVAMGEEMPSGAEQVGDVRVAGGKVVGILVGFGVGGADQDAFTFGFRNAEHHSTIIGMPECDRVPQRQAGDWKGYVSALGAAHQRQVWQADL